MLFLKNAENQENTPIRRRYLYLEMFGQLFVVLFLLGGLLTGCKPSYPKEHLIETTLALYKKETPELNPKIEKKGKTLYVWIEMNSLVSDKTQFVTESFSRLDDAMLVLLRVALSTDDDIQCVVLQAHDPKAHLLITIARWVDDIKGLYGKISKPDFDERLILELTRNFPNADIESESDLDKRSKKNSDKRWVTDQRAEWSDISRSQYASRLVASGLNNGLQSNPLLSLLLGVDRVESRYHEPTKSLDLILLGKSDFEVDKSSGAVMEFLEGSIVNQLKRITKKYKEMDWLDKVIVYTDTQKKIIDLKKEDWVDTDK